MSRKLLMDYVIHWGMGKKWCIFYKPEDKAVTLGQSEGVKFVIFAFTNKTTSSMRSSELAYGYVRQL